MVKRIELIVLFVFISSQIRAQIEKETDFHLYRNVYPKIITIKNNLVGWWDFDEGFGSFIYDLSDYKRHGERLLAGSGSYGYWISYKQRTSLRFQWYEYVLLSNQKILSGLNSYTICAWVVVTGYGSQSSGRPIYTERAVTGNDIVKLEALDGISTKEALFTIRDDAGTLLQVRGTSNIVDNNWHFLSAIKNGTTISLYIDGNVENTGTWTGTNNFTDSGIKVELGRDPTFSSLSGWYDKIGEVIIYNRALSKYELDLLYNSTATMIAEISGLQNAMLLRLLSNFNSFSVRRRGQARIQYIR